MASAHNNPIGGNTMKLDPIVTGVKLYCRRLINIGGRNILPGQPFPYDKLSVSWRVVLRLYNQRRVVSENDPYFQELMESCGKTNNPEFAKAWLKANAVENAKKEPPEKKPKKSKRMSGPQRRAHDKKQAKEKADKEAEAERKKAGDAAAGIDPDEGSLEKLTVPKLKEIAKDLEIVGYSSLNKAELIEAIEAAE